MRERVVKKVANCQKKFKGNQAGKTIDGMWTALGLVSFNVGCTDCVDEFDHGMVWVDFDEQEIFGNQENGLVPIEARRCVPGQVKLAKKHSQNPKQFHKENEIKERLIEVARKFEENPDDEKPWKEIDEIDKERSALMLKVEKMWN